MQVDLRYNSGYLASYDTEGQVRWAREVDAFLPHVSGSGGIHDVVARGDRVYVSAGTPHGISETPRWDNPGGILINRYDSHGDSLGVIVLGEVADRKQAALWPGYIDGIGFDLDGNMYIGGAFGDTLFLSPDIILAPIEPAEDISAERADLFVASYTKEGEVHWARRVGGEGSDRLGGMYENAFVVDASGNTYLPSVPITSGIVQYINSVAAVGFMRQDWSGDSA